MPRIEVTAALIGDDGSVVWGYSHGQNIAQSGDLEQDVLSAAGLLNAHLDGAKEAIAEQSAADLKAAKGGRQ